MRALAYSGVLSALTLAASPCVAATPATEAYLANVRLDVDFLIASSRLAEQKARAESIRQFARAELRHQTGVRADLDGSQTPETVASAAASPLETGRSVASGTPVAVDHLSAPEGIGALLPAAAMELDHLSSVDGTTFDGLYRSVETSVLGRLAAFYEAYAMTGDDPALRAMASRELPVIRADLDAIRKM